MRDDSIIDALEAYEHHPELLTKGMVDLLTKADAALGARARERWLQANPPPPADVPIDLVTCAAAVSTPAYVYDSDRFRLAHARFLSHATCLTDDDITQLGVVNGALAERARARRAGVVEAPDPDLEKLGNARLPVRFFLAWLQDGFGPIMQTYRLRHQQAAARIQALEDRIVGLEADQAVKRELVP